MKSKSTERVVRVLTAMSKPDFSPKSMAEIASQAGLAESTIWRTLSTLEELSWVHHDTVNHTWGLGSALAEIAFAFDRHYLKRRKELDKAYIEIAGKTPPSN